MGGGVEAEDAVGAVSLGVIQGGGEGAVEEAEGGGGGGGEDGGFGGEGGVGGGRDFPYRAGEVVDSEVGTAGVADSASGEDVEVAVVEGEAAGEGGGGGDDGDAIGSDGGWRGGGDWGRCRVGGTAAEEGEEKEGGGFCVRHGSRGVSR